MCMKQGQHCDEGSSMDKKYVSHVWRERDKEQGALGV